MSLIMKFLFFLACFTIANHAEKYDYFTLYVQEDRTPQRCFQTNQYHQMIVVDDKGEQCSNFFLAHDNLHTNIGNENLSAEVVGGDVLVFTSDGKTNTYFYAGNHGNVDNKTPDFLVDVDGKSIQFYFCNSESSVFNDTRNDLSQV